VFRAIWADAWFERLKRAVHPVICDNSKGKRVRIAILDSGVDSTHPEMIAAMQDGTIAKYKGFPDSLHPICDLKGHGTHGTSVLIKTAPTATIYVARVADDEGKFIKDNGYFYVAQV